MNYEKLMFAVPSPKSASAHGPFNLRSVWHYRCFRSFTSPAAPLRMTEGNSVQDDTGKASSMVIESGCVYGDIRDIGGGDEKRVS